MTDKKTENDRIHDPDVRNALVAGDVPQDDLAKRDVSKDTEHQRQQHGADVRQPTVAGGEVPMEDFELPDGLKRQRQSPYDKDRVHTQEKS